MTALRRIPGLAAAALIWAAATAEAAEVTLRLHQFLPRQANVPRLILDEWAARVERGSEGRIEVAHFPSMQLGGKPPELIDQALDGVADIVWTVVGYTPGRFPRTEVFELPFMVTDAEAASRAYWQMFEEHMKETEFRDLHVLATWVHGPGILHTNRPVRAPADLRGMKIRGGSRQVNALLDAVGATPVGMPVPAVPEALSKGVIDGATIPWEVAPALKVPELVENHTEFTGPALYTLTFVLAMNKDAYARLPDDLKAVIDANSGEALSAFAGATQAGADAPARAAALERGNTVITLDAAQSAEWQALAEPLYEAWVADMAERGIDGQALIDQARALIAGHGG